MLRYLKTNWFLIGVLLLLAIAIFRKNLQFHLGGAPSAPQEKYIDAGSPATLSIFGDTGRPKIAMSSVAPDIAIPFLQRFGKVTRAEHEKYGVPAAALLALSYVNSFGGTREIAREGNNFFSLSCGANWQGATMQTDAFCFRRYDTPWQSFRDMSQVLIAQDWYAAAKTQAGTDWKKWVQLFAQKGCSDVQNAEAEMINIVQHYRLFELDQQ